jgi:hypothetical protein
MDCVAPGEKKVESKKTRNDFTITLWKFTGKMYSRYSSRKKKDLKCNYRNKPTMNLVLFSQEMFKSHGSVLLSDT